MVEYDLSCPGEDCGHRGTYQHSMVEPHPICPSCNKHTLVNLCAPNVSGGRSENENFSERKGKGVELIALAGSGVSPEFAIEAAKHLPEETNPGDTVRVSIDGTVYEGVATEGGHISGRVTKRP